MSTPAAATGSDSPKLRAGSGMPHAVWLPLGKRAQRASPHVRAPLVPGTATGTSALLFVPHKFTGELCTSDRYSSSYSEAYEPGSGVSAPAVAIIAISSNIATAGKARTGTVRISTAKESR